MPAAPRSATAWAPAIQALIAGAACLGGAAWWFSLKALDGQIEAQRAATRKLTVAGARPDEALRRTLARDGPVEQGYRYWLKRAVTIPPSSVTESSDPQVYVQEQLHEVRRTLERLSTARGLPPPEQLGFPKELPPTKTVPRLLAQLQLVAESASLMLDQGVTAMASVKLEDPEAVPGRSGEEPFLLRLPVRVNVTSSLSGLMKILAALERARPLIEIQAIRLVPGTATETLQAELRLCRYLLTVPPEPSTMNLERTSF